MQIERHRNRLRLSLKTLLLLVATVARHFSLSLLILSSTQLYAVASALAVLYFALIATGTVTALKKKL